MDRILEQEPPRGRSALLAALLSAIIPGLGQIYTGRVRRGLMLLVSVVVGGALLYWRDMHLFLIATAILWLWTVWDASRCAGGEPIRPILALFLAALSFYAVGWELTEINLVDLATQVADIRPVVSSLIFPWDAAFVRDVETTGASAPISVPCPTDSDPPAVPEPKEDQPYIQVQPTCGDLSTYTEQGTTIRIEGFNYRPNESTTIWWKNPIGDEFRPRQRGDIVRVETDDQGHFEVDLIMPNILTPSSAAEGPLRHQVLARQRRPVGPRHPSENLVLALEKMLETIFLGMMATTFGIFFAIPFSFLAARNLMSTTSATVGVYYVIRSVLNVVRSIEPLIWAIIFVVWVGLGPFAGMMALTVHTIAALGKLFSEAIESIDPGPIEAVTATGANRLQVIVYAVMPQVVPPWTAFSIYRWDINVRLSTIVGAVGGGGIGFLLFQWIRLTDYKAAGIATWLIVIVVASMDYLSARVREEIV